MEAICQLYLSITKIHLKAIAKCGKLWDYMTFVEITSRRDFLGLDNIFARSRKERRQAEKQARQQVASSGQPQPPDWNPFDQLTTRRALVGGGVAVGATGVGLAVVDRLGLLKLFPQSSEEDSEILQSLVLDAKKIEDEFEGNDLSDRETRNKYTILLADIFIRYYHLNLSKEQMLSSVIFVNDPLTFEQIFIDKNQDPAFSSDVLKNAAAKTPAFTESEELKIYVNTLNVIFRKDLTDQDPKFPAGWNPLKSLRLTLFHEFSHAIAKPATDPLIFSVLDPLNELTSKRVEGFRFTGRTGRGEFVGAYGPIDEAFVELLSKYINRDLFDSFISEYTHELGMSVSNIMNNLEQILEAAKINRDQLTKYHQDSNLKGFLLKLFERKGTKNTRSTERNQIEDGFILFDVLMTNNQSYIQAYLDQLRSVQR